MNEQLHISNTCPRPEISSYIDAELSPVLEIELEQHLAQCSECSEDLKLQRQFLCALDASLENEPELELPKDFTKIVVTRAESGVRGLRRPTERFNAAFICSGLVLVAVLSLGTDSSMVVAALVSIFEKAVAVGSFLVHVAYDVSVGVVVILRSLSSHFVYSSAEMTAVPAIIAFHIYLFSKVAAFLNRSR